MGWTRKAAAVVFAAALAAPAGAQDSRSTPKYDGKYDASPGFRKQLGQIPAWRTKALANAKTALGLVPKDADRVEIVVKDAIPESPRKLAAFTDPLFQTFTEAGDKDPTVQILVRAEALVNGADAEETLRHEMIHAVMRERMTRESYGAVPKWFREGIAVYGAGQGPGRVRTIVTSREAEKGLEPLFPGIDEGKHDLTRYAEDVLAIDYLVSVAGPGAAKDVTARIVAGTATKDAVAAVAKMPWDEFKAKCRVWSLGAAEKARPPEWPAYLELRELDRAKKFDEAEKACGVFLTKHPGSSLVPDVLYLMGKAQRLAERRPSAVQTLLRLLREHLGRSTYQDEALYQLGMSLHDEKEWNDAAETFERLLRDQPDTPLQDRALYLLASCRAKQGEKKAALAHVELFERSFPKSSFADEVAKLRAELK